MNLRLVLILLVAAVTFADNETDYCRIPTCQYCMHTLCRYPLPGSAYRCRHVFRNGLTDEEETRLLLVHNQLRERVYSGRETRGILGPQLPATQFFPLRWDRELANAAQRWAEQCIPGIDRCRNVERFLVNQLVRIETVRGNPEFLQLERIIFDWYNEVQFFNMHEALLYRNLTSINRSQHYTQLVWAETTRVGCGAIRFTNHRPYNRVFLVCNYGPTGNINGMPVYPVQLFY